eukprot:TRINITY_DN8392_c0_g1_i2.p1 TRINITY_DN8392_c0_g1~~TRINITY_DN8392_c0_g1_i2.p1  ORF type:complete len:719 (-),score=147.49 TRINITY_DN8392_c0_g1_i2:89-2245(-)
MDYKSVTFVILISLAVAVAAASESEPMGNGLPGYTRRFPSMMLSNWKDMMLAWSGPRDNPNELPVRATGVTQLRIADDWSVSGLANDSFMMNVAWNNKETTVLNNPLLWDGAVTFDAETGEFQNAIETYNNLSLPYNLTLTRSFYMPPEESFYVVQYHFESNVVEGLVSIELFDYLLTQPTNCSSGSNGTYSDSIFYSDSTKCNEFCLAAGSYYPVSDYQVGNATGDSSAVNQFESAGDLKRTSQFIASQLSFGTTTFVELTPGESFDVFFYRTLQPTCVDAQSVMARALAQDPSYWLSSTMNSYQAFLDAGIQAKFETTDAKQLYQNSLVLLKNSQNPTLGTFVASFHPAYQFKTWGRDGAFASMIMDAAGYRDEAEVYIVWMSNAELRSDGGFHTCYSLFTGEVVGFVEPQYDSAGAFLMTVYHHYQLLLQDGYQNRTATFLSAVLPRVREIEHFFVSNVDYGGLVPPDYSIWEESSSGSSGDPLPVAYFSFTQAMAYGGLTSAIALESAIGNNKSVPVLQNRTEVLVEGIENKLWISGAGYYARSIWNGTLEVDTRADGSTVALIWTGLANVSRSQSHIAYIQKNLTQDTYGIGRYWGDIFFYSSIYNPGGQEVGAPTPPWGLVTMMTAWSELTLKGDYLDAVPNRLEWMNERAAEGQLPVGEAVDGVTNNFVMSSCPDLYEYGGVYIWTVLMNQTLAWLPNPQLWSVNTTSLVA